MHLVAVVNTEKVIAMCTNRQTHIFILTFVSPLLPVCLSYPALTLATSNFQSSNEYLLLVPFLFQVFPLFFKLHPTLLRSTTVTLVLSWHPPLYGAGALVNYTITVSPALGSFTTSVEVTVPYNVMHTVSIVASNCNGSSSPALESIRIGMIYLGNCNLTCFQLNLAVLHHVHSHIGNAKC